MAPKNGVFSIPRSTASWWSGGRVENFAAGPVEIHVGAHPVPRVVSTYADAAAGEVCALFGSTDHLEVSANGASAADALDLRRGAPVHVARRA